MKRERDKDKLKGSFSFIVEIKIFSNIIIFQHARHTQFFTGTHNYNIFFLN